MRVRPRALILPYGGVVLSVVLATVVRRLLDPVLGDGFPFLTYFPALVIMAWYGGMGPALGTLLLSSFAVAVFILQPRGSWYIQGFDNQVGFGIFLFVGLAIAFLSGSMQAARLRAEAALHDAFRSQQWLRITLVSIGDAVIATDTRGDVTFLNPVAQLLTGWTEGEAVGQSLETVFDIRREDTGEAVDNPVTRVLREGIVVGLGNHTVLIARDGSERPIDDSAAPIRAEDGTLGGVVLIFRDVTERRRLERWQQDQAEELEKQVQLRTAQLRESEERFRLLVEGTSDYALFLLDPDGRVVSWNPGAERIKGFQAEEIIGQHFSRFYPPDVPRTLAPDQELHIAAAQGKYEEEGWRLRKDGSRFWASVLITALRNADGSLRGYSKITRDLTERKTAEENARRLIEERAAREAAEAAERRVRVSEEQFRRAVVDAPIPILMVAEDGAILQVSHALTRLSGYRREELSTFRDWLVRATGPQAEAIAADVRRLFDRADSIDSQEVTITTTGGEKRLWQFTASAPGRLADGRRFLVAMATDVTDRKRAEQTAHFLAEASASLAALVDDESTLQKVTRLAVPFFADWCAVDMAEPDGSVRRVAVAHVDPSKVALAHELHRRFPPDPSAPTGVYHILRTGQPEVITEITAAVLAETVHDPELLGIIRDLGLKSYIGVPLRTRERTLGVLTFIRAESGRHYDATDLAVAEDLAHRAAIAIENAHLYGEVKQADRLKTEFLATLAHELRNPLAPIRTALEVMKHPTAQEAEVGQVREMAERQVQHMARLLDDLLDVARISRGRIELRMEPVPIAPLVQRTLEAVRPAIEDRGHALTVNLPPDVLSVPGDPTRLEQVLTNLLYNAVKFTDPGGHIVVSAERDGSEVVLRVRDTGIGIAPDMLPRIFDLFVQAERRLDRARGGVGIGLTLAKKLVDLHGGSIRAYSAGPGQGSEFVIRLPLAAAPVAEPEGPRDQGSAFPQLPAHRILVVDDSVDAADSLALLLKLSGQEVRVAYDGPTALLTAQAFHPQLVLLDIGMPSMDGYEVARHLRQLPELGSMKVVALTGWGQEEDRRRSLEAGFDLHLVKPVQPEALWELLANPSLVASA